MAFLGEAKGFNHKFGASNINIGALTTRIPYLDAHQVGGRGHGLC
jgi:hypothetical protein